jgi:hypothetical protein
MPRGTTRTRSAGTPRTSTTASRTTPDGTTTRPARRALAVSARRRCRALAGLHHSGCVMDSTSYTVRTESPRQPAGSTYPGPCSTSAPHRRHSPGSTTCSYTMRPGRLWLHHGATCGVTPEHRSAAPSKPGRWTISTSCAPPVSHRPRQRPSMAVSTPDWRPPNSMASTATLTHRHPLSRASTRSGRPPPSVRGSAVGAPARAPPGRSVPPAQGRQAAAEPRPPAPRRSPAPRPAL